MNIITKSKGKRNFVQKIVLKAFFVVGTITIFVLSLYLIQIFLINNNYETKNISPNSVLGMETESADEMNISAFWKDYLSKYPNYFPGWLELARLGSETSNYNEFREALEKAEDLNPNSEEVLKLKFQYGF